MKVRFATTYPPTSCGIATYSQHYVEELRKLCDVDVLPIERPKINPLYFLGLALRARKGVDIVHVQFDCGFFGTFGRGRLSLSGMYVPLFYFILRLPGGPRVVTTVHELHDAKKDYAGRWLYWPMRAYYTLVYLPMMAFSSRVLAHTEDTVRALSQYGPAGNTIILPHASFIRPVFLPQDECKARLGLSGRRVVTMFGYVSRSKGQDLAVDAIRKMPGDVLLYIAGDGREPEDRDFLESLKVKVKEDGLESRVKFHGFVRDEDVPVVMGAADVILMPYRHVIQSGALGYALAYNKPVLASDIGGFAEVARQSRCIETFKAGDPGDMEKKLELLLSSREHVERLVSGIGAYVDSVDIGRISRRTMEIYESVMGRGPGPS